MNLKNKKKFKIKFSAGFTLMEVMLSVAILSMGIVASFSLIGLSMAKFSSATNRIIAVNLAQDGIERVRNARDTNWLQDKTKPDNDVAANACSNSNNFWDCEIEGRDTGSGQKFVKFSCVDGQIDKMINANDMLDDTDNSITENDQIDRCIAKNKCDLKKYTYAPDARQCISDDVSGAQKDGDNNNYTQTNYPNFYRLIHIKRLDDFSNQVSVTVKWIDKGVNRYFTIQEILYNWQETN